MSKIKSRRESQALQVKPPCLERVRAVSRLCVLYPGVRLTTDEKHGKDISQGSPKVPVRYESVSHYGNLLVRLCGLVVRVSGYRYRGPGFDSRRYQIF